MKLIFQISTCTTLVEERMKKKHVTELKLPNSTSDFPEHSDGLCNTSEEYFSFQMRVTQLPWDL